MFEIFSTDIMPRNITVATDTIKHVNIIPVYGKIFALYFYSYNHNKAFLFGSYLINIIVFFCTLKNYMLITYWLINVFLFINICKYKHTYIYKIVEGL